MGRWGVKLKIYTRRCADGPAKQARAYEGEGVEEYLAVDPGQRQKTPRLSRSLSQKG